MHNQWTNDFSAAFASLLVLITAPFLSMIDTKHIASQEVAYDYNYSTDYYVWDTYEYSYYSPLQ